MTATVSLHQNVRIDSALRKDAMAFIRQLMSGSGQSNQLLVDIPDSADKRVRLGQITDTISGILFELRDDKSLHYVLVRVLEHGDATELARRLTLQVNPVNGITELIEASRDEVTLQSVSTPETSAPTTRSRIMPPEITADSLTTALGIDSNIALRIMEADSTESIDEILTNRPAWERDAILALVSGLSIDEVRDSLGLGEDEHGTDDAQLIDGIKTPGAQLEFAFLEDATDDELRHILETGDFNSWTIFIHPEQRDVVERNYSGSGRVFGGAGTGKTVVTVHRAHRLATECTPAPRILLTTYTRSLAESLESHMTTLDPVYPKAQAAGDSGIWTSGIDALVIQVLHDATPSEVMAATKIVLGESTPTVRPFPTHGESRAWIETIEGNDSSLSPAIANESFLAQELETIVIAQGITTEKEYLRARRQGRGTALNRQQRKDVWALLYAFQLASARDGQLTWQALAAVAAQILRQRTDERHEYLFDHVLVDEAQDFHAGHWLFLRSCVAEGPNDIFISEDAHQRIYGQHFVLSRFGITTRGRASRRLKLNYRTTRENLDYALQILEGTWLDAEGEEDSTRGYRSARSGPKPEVMSFDSEAAEFAGIAELITTWKDHDPNARIGVLARTHPLVNRATSALTERGINAVKTANAQLRDTTAVQVMTMHGAKGLEFTHVILVGVDANVMPQQYAFKGLGEAEKEDYLQRERSLLYVASSRARDQLVITSNGTRSSLIPER